ncbi:MAG: response regulator transcription factor [Candidatus Binatia bacterium]
MPKSQPPTIFIVDDDDDFRETLRLPLESEGHVVKTFAAADTFLETFEPGTPGCLLLDVRMPGLSGIALQEELARRGIDLPIVFLTGYGEVPTAVRALKQGAVDFLQKPFEEEVLLERVSEALSRDSSARGARARAESVAARYATLSEREREVMRRMVAGEASKVIALDLELSLKTVELHRRSVMQKMEADSIPALVELALVLEKSEPRGAG